MSAPRARRNLSVSFRFCSGRPGSASAAVAPPPSLSAFGLCADSAGAEACRRACRNASEKLRSPLAAAPWRRGFSSSSCLRSVARATARPRHPAAESSRKEAELREARSAALARDAELARLLRQERQETERLNQDLVLWEGNLQVQQSPATPLRWAPCGGAELTGLRSTDFREISWGREGVARRGVVGQPGPVRRVPVATIWRLRRRRRRQRPPFYIPRTGGRPARSRQTSGTRRPPLKRWNGPDLRWRRSHDFPHFLRRIIGSSSS